MNAIYISGYWWGVGIFALAVLWLVDPNKRDTLISICMWSWQAGVLSLIAGLLDWFRVGPADAAIGLTLYLFWCLLAVFISKYAYGERDWFFMAPLPMLGGPS